MRPFALAVLALALGTACAHAAPSQYSSRDTDVLPGWKGETYKHVDFFWDPLKKEPFDDIPLPASKSWIEHVAWKPRVFIYHNFITDVEAKHLIELAAPQMKRSTVVGAGGKSVEDNYRTSYGTFLKRYQDDIVERIENRVAAWTQIPVAHQEDTQILRYGLGQQYKVHADTLRDDEAGVRVATVLIYLNEPDEGGETAFPTSEWVNPQLARTLGANFSACAKNHVAFAPKRGDALLFWSINPDGTTEDNHASHTGCPVLSGVKWTATKWIHARPFRPNEMAAGRPHDPYVKDPGVCYDESPSCSEWAARGDCEKNHDFMVVNAVAPGVCRKSCGACRECAKDDLACYNENRVKVGFLVYNASELAPFRPMV
ncbi:hypothetical protein HYH02_008339 [Chlamydomonas schloesseri]|uniref:procollagen-proline 4-dioxygenase n=1 Tax=Chlamydomonas schloesseri TaxID=2026947 RepID=A0A835WGF3_9CHLO|nr:hypothetical protein HYH02_008339 [Chlamydomonas schloesseri]|eukprot:KAG2446779.1 hypothetical protein HYH02_008339 [Chlamydomonas schloesseri]